MPEAMAKLKKAYGSEAVILYTRNVKKSNGSACAKKMPSKLSQVSSKV